MFNDVETDIYVPLSEQIFGKVGAVLSGNTRDQCGPVGWHGYAPRVIVQQIGRSKCLDAEKTE
jgi:hypothetical protein